MSTPRCLIAMAILSVSVSLGGVAAAAQAGAPKAPAAKPAPKKPAATPPKYRAPAPRSRAEVQAALAKAPKPPSDDKLRPLSVVLVADRKDHGADEHDYPLWQKRWQVLLGGATGAEGEAKQVNLYGPAVGGGDALAGATKVTVTTAKGWPDKKQLESANLIVAFCYVQWNDQLLKELDSFLARGGGFVAVHPAVITDKKLAPRLAELLGLCWQNGYTTYRHGPVALKITAPDDPVALGSPAVIHLEDESYYPMVGERSPVKVIATCDEVPPELGKTPGAAKKPYEMFWTRRRGKGRVFTCILGHFTWTFDDPYFRMLLLRGMAWAAGESPYRFDPLILRGVTLREEGDDKAGGAPGPAGAPSVNTAANSAAVAPSPAVAPGRPAAPGTAATRRAGEFPSFRYHQIGDCGRKMGQTALVDVDRDGDLDWVVGAGGADVWWFEYQAPDRWVRHTIGTKSATEVGGVAFDVDGDGWVDVVCGASWYRNTHRPRAEPFTRHDNGAIQRAHDNVAADVDGDGKPDVVMLSDRDGLWWYKIPADPTQPWLGHKIGAGVHGGVAPAGVGDLDGDGDNDVVRSNVWFENADGKGTRWVEHKDFDFGQPKAQFPLTTKSWVVDLDGDGDKDVVMVECDCQAGRAAWFENADGRGTRWVRHMIAETDQDLHSLAVADFDGDGDLDVFSGGGPLSKSEHRWIIWENLDGKGARWQEHVILRGKRCHEAVAADVDQDGDVDICSKPWNGSLHVYMENLLKSPKAHPATTKDAGGSPGSVGAPGVGTAANGVPMNIGMAPSPNMAPEEAVAPRLDAIKTVRIGDNREFLVNGKPFFPLMLWLQSDARIPDGLSIGVNTFCANGGDLTGKAYLDKLAAGGLYGIVHFDPALVGHSHLLGWIHGDEPDLPTSKSDAQVVPGKGLAINKSTPLWRILDGVTHSWSVLDPLPGAEITIKLPAPVTAEKLVVHLTISKGLAVAKDVAFLGDGKEIASGTLRNAKVPQTLALAQPATFRELTFRVVSTYPGEQVWGSIGEIEALDKAGQDVILSKPRTVPRHTVEEVAATYRKIKAGDPDRPVLVTFTAYFMKAFTDKYDQATKDKLYPGFVKSCDVAGYDIYPIFGWGKPEWLPRVADGVTELRAIAGERRALYAWIETNVGSQWVSPSAQKPLTPRHTRGEVWMAIIRGATAIGYFTHQWRPSYKQFAPTDEMRKELKRLDDQITRLAAAILAPAATRTMDIRMAKPAACHLKATQYDGALYVFAQSLALEGPAAAATISIEGLNAGTTVEVVDEGRRLAAEDGRFTDTFEPLAEHIYRIKP